MNKKIYIVFIALVLILQILRMTHGAPQAMNVWEFWDYIRH